MVNQLPTLKRVRVLHQLLEGNSMRGVCRMEDVNYRTVAKLQSDAARAARRYHRKYVTDVPVNSVQIDELWSFCRTKQKRLEKFQINDKDAGDVWTWLAIESDDKLILSYLVADRGQRSCNKFIKDLQQRIDYDTDLEIFTDGHKPYPKAIKKYFGTKISYSQLVKTIKGDEPMIEDRQIYGKKRSNRSTTSYIERCNLTVRQSNRRYSRKTNGFSKTITGHRESVDLFIMYYNWIRIHDTLRTTPAVKAGLAKEPYSLERLVARIDQMNKQDRQKRQLYTRLEIQ